MFVASFLLLFTTLSSSLPPATSFSIGGGSRSLSSSSFLRRACAASTFSTSLSMFTGIVEEIGTVRSLTRNPAMTLWDGSKGEGTELVVESRVAMEGAYLGCSISVNGVCLTATSLDGSGSRFTAGLAPETLRLTNLGGLEPGSPVNVERASEVGGRNSGHFVQGHVDCTGTIADKWVDGDSLFVRLKAPPKAMKYIVPKGFVALDGTSLTVCEVNRDEGWFTFMLVEYTQKKIVIPGKEVGEEVNIEVDVLGKYADAAGEGVRERVEELEREVEELKRLIKGKA